MNEKIPETKVHPYFVEMITQSNISQLNLVPWHKLLMLPRISFPKHQTQDSWPFYVTKRLWIMKLGIIHLNVRQPTRYLIKVRIHYNKRPEQRSKKISLCLVPSSISSELLEATLPQTRKKTDYHLLTSNRFPPSSPFFTCHPYIASTIIHLSPLAYVVTKMSRGRGLKKKKRKKNQS